MMDETSAQATARPNFESAMEASALAQVRFAIQTSVARYGCAEASGCQQLVLIARSSANIFKSWILHVDRSLYS